MDSNSSTAATPKDFPSEAELEQVRKNSTMTRAEALRALDRATRLCTMLMERIEELQQVGCKPGTATTATEEAANDRIDTDRG